jgi:hypothetical protein
MKCELQEHTLELDARGEARPLELVEFRSALLKSVIFDRNEDGFDFVRIETNRGVILIKEVGDCGAIEVFTSGGNQ